MRGNQDIRFQDLDPDKIWVITAPTAQSAEEIKEGLEGWQKEHHITINGIIVSDGIDFKEVSDEWMEAYIRSLQDILLERKK